MISSIKQLLKLLKLLLTLNFVKIRCHTIGNPKVLCIIGKLIKNLPKETDTTGKFWPRVRGKRTLGGKEEIQSRRITLSSSCYDIQSLLFSFFH